METIVYSNREAHGYQALHTSEGASSPHTTAMADAGRETGPLPLDLLFPVVTARRWSPGRTGSPRAWFLMARAGQSPAEMLHTLTQLKAPPEVLETLHWSWKLGLFEAYEVRTPVRQDMRDPLLLGRVGEQRYRLALWGESLLPLEQMTMLVQQSLALRTRVEKRKGWVALGGTLLGLAVGLLWAWFSPEAEPIGISLLFAFVGFFLAWLPTFLYTPENRQHDFLDRYRC